MFYTENLFCNDVCQDIHVFRYLILCFSISVYESFQDYIKVESLDGENKYDAGEHGLQVMCLLLTPYV